MATAITFVKLKLEHYDNLLLVINSVLDMVKGTIGDIIIEEIMPITDGIKPVLLLILMAFRKTIAQQKTLMVKFYYNLDYCGVVQFWFSVKRVLIIQT